MYPFYNDADEKFQEKLRLDEDLNEVVIGHWKNYDKSNEYYSKVSTLKEQICLRDMAITHLYVFNIYIIITFIFIGKHDCIN